jgi:hypothetical protein
MSDLGISLFVIEQAGRAARLDIQMVCSQTPLACLMEPLSACP